jgi:hypothetical protein
LNDTDQIVHKEYCNTIQNFTYGLTVIFFIISISFSKASAQASRENPLLKWTTWTIFQALPSPVFFEDNGKGNHGTEFGFEWQVTPLSYTFKPNKYLNHFSALLIKPVKKFTGSAEIFFTPQFALSSFDYSGAQRYMYNAGGRAYFPLVQGGEYLSFSLGAGYYSQKNEFNSKVSGVMYEAGIYSVFGMFGLKFTYKQNAISKYNVGFYLKYY